MADLERFGNYLLLKKLGEDPLGESFRAGRVSGEELEEVVLLRVFNGQGVAGERLASAMGQRKNLTDSLTAAAAAPAVDIGSVAGSPYAAWDYVAGRTLSTVLELGASEQLPLPVDHALLIAERLSLTAASAEEIRHDGQRLLHGFLVPALVSLSAEGEIRLAGFEAGPGLRQLAAEDGPLAEAYGPYLSPEARRGEPADRADACWSLGAILLEMLTGSPPSGDTPDLSGLSSATDGSPLPPQLLDLLSRSLTTRESRISDAGAWHRELSKILAEGEYSPTTFNLAFYMHSLLRDSLEQEAEAVGAEKEAGREALAATVSDGAPSSEDEMVPTTGRGVASAQGRRRSLWLGAAAVVAAAALLVAGWWYLNRQTELGGETTTAATAPERGQTTTPSIPATRPPTTSVPPAQVGNPPELVAKEEQAEEAEDELATLEERMMTMLDTRTQEMSAEIQQQYQQQLNDLQQELEEARATAAERQRALDAARERAEQQAEEPAQAAETEGGEPTSPPLEVTQVEAEPGMGADEITATEMEAATTDEESVETPATAEVAEARRAQEERSNEPTNTGRTATQSPPEQRESAAPAEPRVQRGQLVSLGPGVQPPVRLSEPVPTYPPIARRMGRQATVQLRVLVDDNGNVEKVERIGSEVGMGFDREAMKAARDTKWEPATKDGVQVKVWVPFSIRFQL